MTISKSARASLRKSGAISPLATNYAFWRWGRSNGQVVRWMAHPEPRAPAQIHAAQIAYAALFK